MTALDDLNTKIDTLTSALAAEQGKTDALLTAFNSLQNQLASVLANSGGNGATDAQLQAIAAKVDAAIASVNTEAGKEGAALAPAAPAATIQPVDPSSPAAT